MRPAILDIEASGFGHGSYPIEIGIILPNSDIHGFLIKPETGWTHWDTTAEQLHGISRLELERQGKPARDIASRINRILDGTIIYSDAWGHDFAWLYRLFHVAKLSPRFKFDTIISLLTEEQMNRWNSEKERQFSLVPGTRHRASIDALVVQNTICELTLDNVVQPGPTAHNYDAFMSS